MLFWRRCCCSGQRWRRSGRNALRVRAVRAGHTGTHVQGRRSHFSVLGPGARTGSTTVSRWCIARRHARRFERRSSTANVRAKPSSRRSLSTILRKMDRYVSSDLSGDRTSTCNWSHSSAAVQKSRIKRYNIGMTGGTSASGPSSALQGVLQMHAALLRIVRVFRDQDVPKLHRISFLCSPRPA